MSHTRTLPALLLVLGPVALLAGCGGGGGGSSSGGGGSNPTPTPTTTGAIAGKVVDTTGSPIVSGALLLDGVQQFSTAQNGGTSYASGGLTFSQGGYQLAGVPGGKVHVVKVQTTVGGVTDTGSTQVILPSGGGLVSNANIIVSPTTQQATVHGFVRDQNGNGIPGAQVYFQSAFTTSPTSGTQANVSLVAVTFAQGTDSQGTARQAGEYEIDNLPVLNGTAPRAYTITASYTNGSGATETTTPTAGPALTAGENLALGSGPNFTLNVTSTGTGLFTPTITLLQSFTQPDIPAFYAQGSVRANAATAATAYDGIRAALSPAFAKLKAGGRAASVVKRLAAASPHASAGANTVEMDLFFSLPGDANGAGSRSSLSGFEVYNNSSGAIAPYDFLQDPLANFYDDPDVGAAITYVPGTGYQFFVQSIGLNGSSVLGQSASVSVDPLAFLNLTQPVDPNDTGGAVQTLSAPDTITWGGIAGVSSYSVFLYGTFPGVSTTPLPQSAIGTGALPGTATSYTIPSGLTPGHQYWVVVAAAAPGLPNSNASDTSAISVSQIVPFIAQ